MRTLALALAILAAPSLVLAHGSVHAQWSDNGDGTYSLTIPNIPHATVHKVEKARKKMRRDYQYQEEAPITPRQFIRYVLFGKAFDRGESIVGYVTRVVNKWRKRAERLHIDALPTHPEDTETIPDPPPQPTPEPE